MIEDHFKVRDKQAGNRYFVDNAFLRQWGGKLGPHCIAVYSALAMYSDVNDQTAYPSFQTIADLTGMSRRQVLREIEKLKENNIIRVDERVEVSSESGNKYHLTNIFTLLHPDEWKGNQCIHEPSDSVSLPLETVSHQSGDSESSQVVTPSHPNNTHLNKTQPTTKERAAISRAPAHQKPDTILVYQIFTEETKRHCLNNAQIEVIQKEVGTDPDALQRWRESVRAWNLTGNNLTDATGMLDWFRTGKRSNFKGNGNGTHSNVSAQQPVSLDAKSLAIAAALKSKSKGATT